MNENVVSLPGVFRSDLESEVPPTTVLRRALDLPLKDVVIIGRTINGDIEVLASQVDADAAVGLLMRGIQFLSSATQVGEPDA